MRIFRIGAAVAALLTVTACAGADSIPPPVIPRVDPSRATYPFDGWVRTSSHVFTARLSGVIRDDAFDASSGLAFRELEVEALSVIKGDLAGRATIRVLHEDWGSGTRLTSQDVGREVLMTGDLLRDVESSDGAIRYEEIIAFVSQATYLKTERGSEEFGVRLLSPHAKQEGGYEGTRAAIESRLSAGKGLRDVDAPLWPVLLRHARSPETGRSQLGYEEAKGGA